MEKWDWIGLFALFLMLGSASIITYYLITENINSCTSHPAIYGANKYVAGKYNYSYVELRVYSDVYSQYPLDTFKFNLREQTDRIGLNSYSKEEIQSILDKINKVPLV